MVAITDAVVLMGKLPGSLPASVRWGTHLFCAGHLLAIGFGLATCQAAWSRFGPRRWYAAYGVMAAASWGLGAVFYGEDISGLSDSWAKKTGTPMLMIAVITLGISLLLPVVAGLGRLLARPIAWPLGVLAGVAGAAANGMDHDYPNIHLLITPSYPGVHLFLAVLSVLLIGRAFTGAPRALLGWSSRRRARIFVAAAALFAAGSLAVWPNNAVGLQLSRHHGAVLFLFLGPLHTIEFGAGPPKIAEEQRPWFEDRASQPPVPPTEPSLLPDDAIVLLLGIDSMRGHLMNEESNRAAFPTLFSLRDQSVHFSSARAPGSSTVPSLSGLFASKPYSQLYWVRGANPMDSMVYPDKDPTPRFPELLAEAGVRTVTYEAVGWLLNRLGIVRGFQEERSLRKGSGSYPLASVTLAPVLEQLRAYEGGRLFLFAHLMDAHSPYTSAGKKASPYEGYLAELSQVDREVKVVLDTLRAERLLDKTCIIVMSDHGEAFGEHGLKRHAVSLYEELIHVPLFIRVPRAKPRVVGDVVSLLDVGPTILDLMGVPTPGEYMGQSLTGYLRGGAPRLTRPVVAEGRLKRAMVLPDGTKIIHDTRTHVVEIYDLSTDPGELTNLFRDDDPRSHELAHTLTSYFDAHQVRRPGYRVPYRKW